MGMEGVWFAYRRRMIRLPWKLFRSIVPLAARKTARVLGQLDDEHRRVHHFVVRALPGLAQPMSPAYIASSLQLDEKRVGEILDELERRLIFLYRPGGRDVVWAYPITVEPTPHHLAFSSGERLYAA